MLFVPNSLICNTNGWKWSQAHRATLEKVVKHQTHGIYKSTVSLLAKGDVISHITDLVFNKTQGMLELFLDTIASDAVTCVVYINTKTVTPVHNIYHLK